MIVKDKVSLNSEDCIDRAAQLMNQFAVGLIPVCNQKKLVKIVTDRDTIL